MHGYRNHPGTRKRRGYCLPSILLKPSVQTGKSCRLPVELDIEACTSFLEFLATYCIDAGLKLYAIFDQHNGLPEELWSTFPFSIPHEYLATQPLWRKAKALVVVAASASNGYYLRTAFVNSWPTLYINKGFTEAEALAFLDHRQFFNCFANNKEVIASFKLRQRAQLILLLLFHRKKLVRQYTSNCLLKLLAIYHWS